MDQSALNHALDECRAAIGGEWVVTDSGELTAAESATFATTQRIAAILRPADRDGVQAVVRVANRYRMPLYPISRGRNWGLGSRVPPRDGCILLDLGRLKTIRDFNEQLAFITVEPGVTFQQTYEFLTGRGSNLMAPVTGGPPDGSLIGNALERGDGAGPYGDRWLHACALEVVLPTGVCIHTGYGRFADCRATPVSRYGVGPGLDGLFAQSNLGIVTAMTFWLLPRPAHLEQFVFRLSGRRELGAFLEAAGRLVLHSVLGPNSFSVWNAPKTRAVAAQFAGRPPDMFDDDAWLGGGAIFAHDRGIADAQRSAIRSALEPLVREITFFEGMTGPADIENPWLGKPSITNLHSISTAMPRPPDGHIDPDRDRCGVIWLCPELPLDVDVIVPALETIEATAGPHGYEPHIGLSTATGRSVRLFVSLVYDRDVPGEDERAMRCHDDVLNRLAQLGCLPYRLGIHSMDRLPMPGDASGELLSDLKKCLDPHDVLAPGRYDFRETWPR